MKHDLLKKIRFYAKRLRQIKGNGIDMEDIEQELMCELLKAMEFFNSSRGNINAFAENILLNRSKNYLRNSSTLKKGRAVIFESVEHLEELGEIIADPCDDWDEKIIGRIDLEKSINRLPTFHMQLCNLLKHYSINEVAKLLKIPYAELHFEIKKIRKKLAKEYER